MTPPRGFNFGDDKPGVTLRDKVDHVLGSKQTRKHACHWPGCDKQVPPAMWGCGAHWRALPKALRDKVWAAYRPGQESDGNPSAEYLDVANEVQDWIAAREAKK